MQDAPPPTDPYDPAPVGLEKAEQQSLEIHGVVAPVPRRGRLVAVGISVAAAVVLIGAAVLPSVLGDERSTDGGPRAVAGITGLKTYSGLVTDHTTDAVDYPQSPAVGGAHDPIWLACGAYDEPIREENAVHDLEHGAVWIAYRPGLSAANVAVLTDLLPDNALLSPYPGLGSAVVLTAWGVQLEVDRVSDPRVTQFLARFGNSQASLEPSVTCAGGIPDARGGRTGTEAGDGSGTAV